MTLSADSLCGIAKLQNSNCVSASETWPLSAKLTVGVPRGGIRGDQQAEDITVPADVQSEWRLVNRVVVRE
jgi:hypothetical protein